MKKNFMTEHIINRLHFITNTGVVRKHIARRGHTGSPPEFSLNSIRPVPEALLLPLDERILRLSALNIRLPEPGDRMREPALAAITFGNPDNASEHDLPAQIEEMKKSLSGASDTTRETFEKAVSNYHRCQFFSQYDWRFTHWGTVEDILSVTADTFHPESPFIEFTTRWTPPLPALRMLADTFPSVRFQLKYHGLPEDPWITEDIFPITPFGY